MWTWTHCFECGKRCGGRGKRCGGRGKRCGGSGKCCDGRGRFCDWDNPFMGPQTTPDCVPTIAVKSVQFLNY